MNARLGAVSAAMLDRLQQPAPLDYRKCPDPACRHYTAQHCAPRRKRPWEGLRGCRAWVPDNNDSECKCQGWPSE